MHTPLLFVEKSHDGILPYTHQNSNSNSNCNNTIKIKAHIDEDEEKTESLYIAGRTVNIVGSLEKQFGPPSKC